MAIFYFQKNPFWGLGNLYIRKFAVAFVVQFGIVCERFCVLGLEQVERRDILNIMCSFFYFTYLVIILRKTGSAIAIMTILNTMSIISSVDICGMPAPSTMTFLSASEA